MIAPAKKVLAPENDVPAQKDPTPQKVPEINGDTRHRPRPGNPLPSGYASFARALRDAMNRQNLSASEVARRIWGTATDKRGYEVAKNRDRIGHYLAGTSYPEPENLVKLANAVGVPIEDLTVEKRAGPRRGPAVDDEMQLDDVKIVYVGGDLRAAQVMLNKRIYGQFVEKLLALLKENDAVGLTLEDPLRIKLDPNEPDPVDEAADAA